MTDHSDSRFLTMVLTAFEEFLQRGLLHVGASVQEPSGNALVVLTARHFELRLITDRGAEFAEARRRGAPDDQWRPLERVLHAVGRAEALWEAARPIEQIASLVEEHFDALDAGLSPRGYRRMRRAMEKLDAAAWRAQAAGSAGIIAAAADRARRAAARRKR